MNDHCWIYPVELTPPTLQNNTADIDRLAASLKNQTGAKAVSVPLSLMKRAPGLLRKWNYRAKCAVFREQEICRVTGMLPPDHPSPPGIAVDLGTSRVVLRVIDLENQETLGETSFDNPQTTIGPDVLTRIHHGERQKEPSECTRLIINGLNDGIRQLTRSLGLHHRDICLMAVSGNTTMTHLFLGLETRWIIREPYIPAVNRPNLLCAGELGLEIHPSAGVYLFPNIGSYFGGDLIAGILYSGLNRSESTSLLVDVGTNAEVVLGNRHWLIACAGAAGPALEGGVTKMGMMASPGVIDSVTIDRAKKTFQIGTIDQQPAIGICGSGLIDLAAQLFSTGMIDMRGKLVPSECGKRYGSDDGVPYVVVATADQTKSGNRIVVTQVDIDSLVRSKAAMFTILETITSTVEMTPMDIERFFVGGTFGSFIKPESAISIGMLPDLPLDHYVPLGNSSLEGASMFLRSPSCIEEIERIQERITYLELNVNQEFMNRFSAAKFIPHTNPDLFQNAGGRHAQKR